MTAVVAGGAREGGRGETTEGVEGEVAILKSHLCIGCLYAVEQRPLFLGGSRDE